MTVPWVIGDDQTINEIRRGKRLFSIGWPTEKEEASDGEADSAEQDGPKKVQR